MAFFSTVFSLADPAVPAPTPLPKEIKCFLRLFVNPTNGEYSYQFSDLTYLLEHKDDSLIFIIRNEIPNTKAYIAAHLHSGPLKNTAGLDRLSIHRLNGTAVPGTEPYSTVKPSQATYKLNIDAHDLIHIGLVVYILDDRDQILKKLLCDPQVGNGPP